MIDGELWGVVLSVHVTNSKPIQGGRVRIVAIAVTKL